MKALVYHGPGHKQWETVPDPVIEDPTDIIVRIDTTTICGSDLHILKGDVPAVTPGRILGHEGVGTVVDPGHSTKFSEGQRVVVPAISSCGTCRYCRVGHPSHCENSPLGIGWALGHTVNGTQAEYVRVPFGETSLHRVPESLTDDEVIFVSDIFPTGYEMGVLAGNVRPGDNVVCIGAGPVGLAAMTTAQFLGPRRVVAVDLDPFRLEQAVEYFGATHAVNSGHDGWLDEVRELCGGGADVVMEAVGIPTTLEAAFDLVRPCGHVANIGVHGKPVTLPIDRLWIENLTITMGLVNGVTAPMMIDMIESGKLNLKPMGTHEFTLGNMMDAYETFGSAAKNDALKVIIRR